VSESQPIYFETEMLFVCRKLSWYDVSRLAYNVLQLAAGGAFGAQNCQAATKIIKCTKL